MWNWLYGSQAAFKNFPFVVAALDFATNSDRHLNFFLASSSIKTEKFKIAFLHALQAKGRRVKNSLGCSQVSWSLLCFLSSLQSVCCFEAGAWVWDVCLLSVLPAASLTSWLAYVHRSLFIKLVDIVLNKHIKETFWMSLAEQTKIIDGSSDTEGDLLAGGFYFH